jgi:transcriptional regulator with XRE-family HTH domain
MRLSDMIGSVKALNRQKLAGRVVRDEIARQRRTVDQTARDARMAPSTLYRILNGDADKDSSKYRAIEGVLGFPDDLLRHIIEGDSGRIEAIRPENIRSSLSDAILYELATIDNEHIEDEGHQQAQQA